MIGYATVYLTVPPVKDNRVVSVRNAAGRKSHPYGPLIRAFYWAVALGQNSQGAGKQGSEEGLRSKGSLRGKGSLRSLRGWGRVL